MTIALVLLALASVATGIWDLVRSNADDVLRAAAVFEGGLLVGTALQLVSPAGFAFGALGGFVLTFTRLNRIVASRREAVDERMVAAPDEASSLLVIHDRIDALAPSGNEVRHAGVFLSLLFMLLFAVGIVAVALSGAWPLLLVGTGLMFLPVAQGIRMIVEFDEHRDLTARLQEIQQASGRVLPTEEPSSASARSRSDP